MFTESHLQAFNAVLRQLNISAWLCGGTVRDLLLQRPLHDVDVVLSDRVFEAAELFREKLDAASFVLDPERQVARVVFKTGSWDISGFRNHTIEGDLAKRDFTINAMAIRWQDFYPDRKLEPVLDLFTGLEDLRLKRLRTVSEESLADDPLRMLRAFRIRAEIGFVIDPDVLRQIEQLHPRIAEVAGERIREEWERILLQPNSAATWKELGQTSLFDSTFPEMAPMKGCSQGGYHHLDVWEHSVAALENEERLLFRLSDVFTEHAPALTQYLTAAPGNLHRAMLLKLAAILHDIGKPKTREEKEPGRYKFYGHDRVGAAIAEGLLMRLKFSRKDTQIVVSMIAHHLRPLLLFKQPEQSEDALYRMFRAAGSEAIGVLLLSIGDMMAARGPLAEPDRDEQFLAMIRRTLDYYFKQYYPAINTPELIKGRDLMAFLHMKPGPLMGQLLQELREAQLTGRLRSREDALEFAQHWLKNKEL